MFVVCEFNVIFMMDFVFVFGKVNMYDFMMIYLNYYDFYWESE